MQCISASKHWKPARITQVLAREFSRVMTPWTMPWPALMLTGLLLPARGAAHQQDAQVRHHNSNSTHAVGQGFEDSLQCTAMRSYLPLATLYLQRGLHIHVCRKACRALSEPAVIGHANRPRKQG